MSVTKADAARLLALAAAYDRRTTSTVDDTAWADALADLDPDECAEAVRGHYRDSSAWLMPSHVRERVREARRTRVLAARNAETLREIETAKPADPSAARRILDEFINPALTKRSDEMLKAQRAERDARKVRCEFCKAGEGRCCTVNGQPRDVAHPSRYEAAGIPEPKPVLVAVPRP